MRSEMLKAKSPARRRILRRTILRALFVTLIILLVALYIGLPAAAGAYALFPGRATVGAPPGGFERVSLLADDQVTLAGWYAPPANRAAILLLHGAGSSRESVRPYIELLRRNGYGVLALDLRGHGESGGQTNRLGWQGAQDVGAALRFLEARPEVEQIGGLGISLGGEVLLGAAGEYPQLAAIVADGASYRSLDELLAMPSERSLLRNFTARVMFLTVQALSRERPPKPLLNSMLAASATRFLLVAAGTDAQEVAFNQLFAQSLGERASLWVAPEAAHTGAFSRYPAEYEERVIGFFDQAFMAQP